MTIPDTVEKKKIASSFLWARRAARQVAETLALVHANARVARRTVKRAESMMEAGRFPPETIAVMRALLAKREESIRTLRAFQVEIGGVLHGVLHMIDVEFSLSERYDLFNVNKVHRQWSEDDAPNSFEMLMVYGVEDSADRHSKDWLDGPVFDCLQARMWNFFQTDPKGRASLDFMTDAAFAPGGPFEHATLQRIGPGGAVEDVPPSERAKPPAGTTLH